MIPEIRQSFNASFTEERYQSFLQDLNSAYPSALDFRVAETPVFVGKTMAAQIKSTCDYIIDFIKRPDFKLLTEKAIPPAEKIMNEDDHPQCMVFDFGICKNEEGDHYPALIEMQGFPSLFAYHAYYPEVLERHFPIPDNFSNYFNGLNKETYIALLEEIIVGEHDPSEVILLEIKPHEQKTRIDFYCTERYIGIKAVCITELVQEGKKLFYLNEGKKTSIKRIYNRVIMDELNAMRGSLGPIIDLTADLDVEWVPHPNWFYRISKFAMPFLDHPCIPRTLFVSELETIPNDLENYVLKPLFSFAGQGVIIDVTRSDIEKIKDPEQWILQKKVNYAPCIDTPDEPAKVELRMMYFWKKGDDRPLLVNNLARLSKGKMIGVRYNKEKTWVGGSVAYFEK